MASYKISFKPSAEKELRRMPAVHRRRLVRRIGDLSQNPRPSGCEKLSAQQRYRIRQGDWRAVYEIDDRVRIVRIFKIGHRREVYR